MGQPGLRVGKRARTHPPPAQPQRVFLNWISLGAGGRSCWQLTEGVSSWSSKTPESRPDHDDGTRSRLPNANVSLFLLLPFHALVSPLLFPFRFLPPRQQLILPFLCVSLRGDGSFASRLSWCLTIRHPARLSLSLCTHLESFLRS